MPSFRPVVLSLALGGLVACHGDQPTGLHTKTTSGPDTPAHLITSPVWAGGEVQVSASAFEGGAALPLLIAGTETLTVRRIDDSTVAARMPTAAGTYALQVKQDTDTATLGPLTLHGYLGETTGPYMSGRAAWVNPGTGDPPVVFASGDSGGILLDLAANSVVGTVPDSITSPDCAMSPGPSYRGAGYFTVQGRKSGTCQYAMSWQVYPTLALADSSSPISGFQWYVMAEVGPKHWFMDNNNHSYAYDCSGSSCAMKSWLEGSGPNGVMIDPTGQRFTWTGQDLHGAVLSAASFDTVLALPPNTSMHGSAFSSGGDTLFFHGGLSVPPYTPYIGAAQSSDGSIVRNLIVDSLGYGHDVSAYGDVAVDPANPWLYVLVVFRDNYALLILDRGTWKAVGVAMLGTLSTEANDDLSANCASIIPDPANHRVYVVATAYGYNIHQHNGEILAFDTP
ncbi:MAG TPA: hypothetical protein VJN62_13740 [Gemmatimonadales bacterium]|nr:hypothetical protein [Gemmatimonadales bacterium]